MQRTQIYLTEEEHRALDRASRKTGLSKSQLIRRAVDDTYLDGRPEPDEARRVLARVAGSWRGRKESGAQYVDRIRPGSLAGRVKR